jgi:predicted Zn-dependent peptidase
VTPVDRSRLPSVGSDPAFALPEIVRHGLANGLQLRTVEHHSVPVLTLTLIVEGGSGADPAGQEGLAALTADMVDEGTGSLSAIDVSDQMARIGAQYDVDVGPDATIFSLTTLGRFADRGAALLASLVTAPSLRDADFTRVRQLRLDRLRQLKDLPATVAERAFLRLAYGEHPYGHLSIGTDASLRTLSLEDVVSFHGAQCRPARETPRRPGNEEQRRPAPATLVIVGAMSHADLRQVAERAFGGWAERDPAAATLPVAAVLPPAPEMPDTRIAIVPRDGAAQSEVRVGHLVTGRNTADYPALLVMNAVLGGQFVSRVNLKLREEKGYTYGARTGFDWRRGPTPFALSAAVHTAATADAIADSLAELEGIRGSRPPTASELDLAKASLTRGYPRNFETAQQVARAVAQLVLYDLPDTYFAEFVGKANRVTAEQVVAAAARHLDPARLTTLIVGDHAAIGDSLRNLMLGQVRILPAG